ncbi:MAG TPA: flavin reductase family protein [Burkholderiales bacterium]|nr:flavin reductase family protein [Burkholderiales bacterium]
MDSAAKTADFHFYEPSKGHGLRFNPFKAIVAPRPIGWISTRSRSGIFNLAPYSYFNAFCDSPPIIGFASSAEGKDSLRNVRETGEFAFNLVTRALAEQMNATSATVAPEVSEFELSGLTPAPSRIISAPRVAESPVSFECKCTEIHQLKSAAGESIPSWLALGEVVAVHIDKAFLRDGIYDTAAAQHLARAGGLGDYFWVEAATHMGMKRPA